MSTTSIHSPVDQTDTQVGAQFDALTKPVVAVRRRTIDKILIGIGVVATGGVRRRRQLAQPGAPTSPTTTSMTSWPRSTSPSPTPSR